ncbi:MAG: class I SAM-dependent methyltransferase [Capsulimonadaceae bacterium]|nr:class I SAM-dependent methyltransferase [Capsulimonadaceae bacterium]
MPQNIYDNPEFFAGYSSLRDRKAGLNDVLEQPAMRSLLPGVHGKTVLDLGCGDGQFCRTLIECGAAAVVGVEISERMLELARSHDNANVTFEHCAIEDFVANDESFDLITSSLAFHYIRDLDKVIVKIAKWLRSGGHLVFSMEHPVCTAAQGIQPGWQTNAGGDREHWILDRYHDEGVRRSHWFVDDVIKYHRTMASVLNMVIESGLSVDRVLEPHAIESAERERPSLLDERRRPPFLLVRARKP